MKRITFLATFIVAIMLSYVNCDAQSLKYDHFRIINRSLSVGKSTPKIADSCAWLEIGDTGTTRGLLLPRTDTGKVIKRKAGLMFYNRSDNCIYYYNGTVLKKITAT